MNVVQTKRKRATNKTANRDYLDFIRINPIGKERQANDSSHGNEYSITTLATRGNSFGKQSSTYISITSGRGYAHGEVGIAYIDIESPAVKLIQLSDDPWYSGLLMKIHIIDPCEILVPDTIFDAKPESSDGKLMKFIREEFPKLFIRKLPRRHFNETVGIELIKKYGSDKYNYVKEEMTAKYYALAAASALLKYLQFVHNIFFKENSLKLDFETKFAHMQIGIDTSHQLELMPQNNPNTVKSKFPSLYSVLDHCVTSFGKRTLRARILEPMCDIPSIMATHECIAELNQQESSEFGPLLQNILRNFNNVERLHKLALVVPQDDNIRAAEVLINQALQLRKCLRLVPLLRTQLSSLMCPKFQEIQENLMDERYTSILNHIDNFMNHNQTEFQSDSSSKLNQHIHCVQEGVNDLIDVLRKSYHDLIGQIEAAVGEMVTKHGQAFKQHYTIKRGFHMTLMIPNRAVTFDFPPEIEVLEIKRNTCHLTTSEVNRLNIRVLSVIEEIIMQSNVVIASMLNDVVKEIDAIYDLSAFTATLDIILSFSTVSATEGFVCPTFGDEMRVVDAVHPLLDQNIHRTVPTPNNIIATPEYNFFMITGPNMSGKTVYIKTVAILQIMAQLGCYVPARSAQFRITDRMFSRMGFNDSIEKNLSTFMLEMNNMEHILKNVTPNSMVIIDELCRSTNPKEGAQLAWNLCEHLAAIHGIFNDGRYFINNENDACPITQSSNSEMLSPKNALVTPTTTTTATHNSSWKNTKLNVITAPFIFLTTHFHSLTALSESCLNVVNLSFSAEEITNNDNERSLVYNHRIQEGVTTTASYGLAVAKTVRFPSDIMNEAFELSHQFTAGLSANNADHPKRELSNVGRQILQLNRNLQAGDSSDMRTVISSMINFPDQNGEHRRHRRLRFNKQNAADNLTGASDNAVSQTITSNSDYDEHIKIDRILYNCFGDLMSITRTTQIEFQTYSSGDEKDKCNAQNEAIENFLAQFIHGQSNEMIEALTNLNLTAEMSTPSVEPIANDVNRQNSAAASDGGANGDGDVDGNAVDNGRIVRSNNSPSEGNAMMVSDDGGGNFSNKSSVISIQKFPPTTLNELQVFLEQRRRLNANAVRSATRDMSGDGTHISSSSLNVSPSQSSTAQSSNKSFSRPSTQSSMFCIPPSFGHTSSQSPGQINDYIRSHFNASPNHVISNDTLFGGPAHNSEFANAKANKGASGHVSTPASQNTFSGFDNFSQGFQSLKNVIHTKSWSSIEDEHEFSDDFFSSKQQNRDLDDNDDGFEFVDNHNDNDFNQLPTNSFGNESFSPNTLNQRSQGNRPIQQNAGKNATSSQLSIHSSAESVSPQSKASNHSFRSNDSVRSDDIRSSSTMGNEQSKPNRKIPIIHPSKLKNTIFGDASKMFGAPAAVNTHRPTTKVIQQQQQQGHPLPINRDMGTNNQIAARTTDTNRNVALQRLQRIELARAGVTAAAAAESTSVSQANVMANQPISSTNPNEETMEIDIDESVVLPPPPGFN